MVENLELQARDAKEQAIRERQVFYMFFIFYLVEFFFKLEKDDAESELAYLKDWSCDRMSFEPCPPGFNPDTMLGQSRLDLFEANAEGWKKDAPKLYKEKRRLVIDKYCHGLKAKTQKRFDSEFGYDAQADDEETETDDETRERRNRQLEDEEMHDVEETTIRRNLMSSSSDREIVVDLTSDIPEPDDPALRLPRDSLELLNEAKEEQKTNVINQPSPAIPTSDTFANIPPTGLLAPTLPNWPHQTRSRRSGGFAPAGRSRGARMQPSSSEAPPLFSATSLTSHYSEHHRNQSRDASSGNDGGQTMEESPRNPQHQAQEARDERFFMGED
ncbi:hypothetical protein RFI_24913 [Reticulomyxa filosa]|uniref:Uncharacterized protein n=1 Tax=Reticulomyxa filosa TaxID=46433 RepID=X6MHD7_RETFI|nr:hypothetical protein RFI_24913 [Reticulomyxa filosa]|eukprot:ETO12470.1 hypothetical protein RFI_24913 [Reticulomyxa filosa]